MSHNDAIKQFIISEFLPDLTTDQLDDDHDLLADSVIDSIGTLKLISWVENNFDLAVEDTEMNPENFRTVTAISAFITERRQRRGVEPQDV
ncbi:phosphopantetheine-binding protein [Lipingzhangella sp. LS1_29]|uniref:Phosphopantetheine-binding protein n=1 Tax=Lipingzhangella rawalii TaxID=2055835 RepID=A0ABU2HAW7_9ACTN|nr:phosphopantetheine-binding protein [Lipingzhangella rawalii]MDS1272467.1 phosphopantetheine-binding protein [Lipingzhangella rawalii]